MDKVTESLKVRETTKQGLDKKRRYPRESYDEIIARLLKGEH